MNDAQLAAAYNEEQQEMPAQPAAAAAAAAQPIQIDPTQVEQVRALAAEGKYDEIGRLVAGLVG